jgi:GntR family transcriptional regulator/MocR family aminotransferase
LLGGGAARPLVLEQAARFNGGAMYIPLDRDSREPLPRQIAGYLEELIRRGHLGAGGRLPATRALAADLGVSKQTVESAYEELAVRRLVRIRPGFGATVRRQIPEDPKLSLGLQQPRQKDPLPRSAWLDPASEAEQLIDLAGVGPRTANLSSQQLRLFHEGALSHAPGPLFSAPPPLGEASLRAAAARHFARCGVLLGADDVAVVPGRAAAMARLLRLFVPRRGTVLADSMLDPELAVPVEERRARLVILPGEAAGRDLAEAVRRSTPRLLVVATGSSRLPGRPPGPARRRALLDLARDAGIPVIEDVTHTEWLGRPPAPPPLAVLEPPGRVISLCDLSDEAGGSFGAAAVGSTAKVLDRLRTAADPTEKTLDRLAQRALALALDAPSRVRTLRALRERRRLLSAAVTRALARRLAASLSHEFSDGADAVRVDLPDGVTGNALREAARDRGVLVRGARDCGAPDAADRFVLLDLTRHDEGDVLEGIRRLGEALDGLPAVTAKQTESERPLA